MTEFRQPRSQVVFSEPSVRGSIQSPTSYHSETQQIPQIHGPPSTHGETFVAPPAGILHGAGRETFNVDPDVSYLESGGITTDDDRIPTPSQSGSRNFVGGFVAGIRRVIRRNNAQRQQYSADATSESTEYRYVSPSPPQPHRSPPASNVVHPGPLPPTHSSSSSSNTAHETLETADTHDGTTIVGHETLPAPIDIGSPIYIEPQLGSDYAKMDSDSPHNSYASFGSYMSRISKFFHDINELPWVAERVTVDYYPGQHRRQVRPRPLPTRHTVTSWYNSHHQQSPPAELFSASPSPPPVTFQIMSPNDPPSNVPYASVVYSTATTAPIAGVTYGPARNLDHNTYPMAMATSHPATTPRRQHDTPMYPHGYVPYHEHNAATSQHAGPSVHMPQSSRV